jgi:sugar phosphate isomerase/epimerase
MLDYGMSTLIELPELEDCAALCRELGLRFIELNMNLPQYQPDRIDVDRFRKIAENYGIYYTIHLDENLNVSDFNHRVASAYLKTVDETIHIAKILSVPILNMHLSDGVYFTLPDKRIYLFADNEELYLDSMRDFRNAMERAIGSSGIRICIENSNGYTDFQTKALDLLLESPVFALTFDIGHNHGIGSKDEPIIMSHVSKLCHMHIHDALGRNNHLSLGDGELDLQKYFGIAEKHNCRVVLETKTVAGLKKSVEWVKERILS